MNWVKIYRETLLVISIITAISLLNLNKLDIKIPEMGFDKIVHFIMYYSLSFSIYYDFEKKKTSPSPLLSIILASIYGLFIEIMQYFVGYRSFDFYDVTANTIGATFGIIFFAFNKRVYNSFLVIINKVD